MPASISNLTLTPAAVSLTSRLADGRSGIISALDQEIQDQVTLFHQLNQTIEELKQAKWLLEGGPKSNKPSPKLIKLMRDPLAAAAKTSTTQLHSVLARRPTAEEIERSNDPKPKPKTRNLSPASRNKIAAAQKLRWRNWKRDQRARQKKEKVS